MLMNVMVKGDQILYKYREEPMFTLDNSHTDISILCASSSNVHITQLTWDLRNMRMVN